MFLAATSMTLLDNLTAQLSPDRKDRFIELFRQLQVSLIDTIQLFVLIFFLKKKE